MVPRHWFLSTVIYSSIYIVIYENKLFFFQIVDLCIRMYLHYIYLHYLLLSTPGLGIEVEG